jgi:hypothetical protein
VNVFAKTVPDSPAFSRGKLSGGLIQLNLILFIGLKKKESILLQEIPVRLQRPARFFETPPVKGF